MTLCIGALAHINRPFSKCIVLCFDSRVGNDEIGSETEYKFLELSDDWVALFAGRPGRAKELAMLYRSELRNGILTDENLLDRLNIPPRIIKQRHASAYIGRTWGISYQEWLDNGERWFGAEQVLKCREQIQKSEIKVEMIFAGFIGDEPILCELRNGDVQHVTNFSLIGTGAYNAEAALHARKQLFSSSVEETLYNTYEAKKAGELSPHVGPETTIYVMTAAPAREKHIRVKRVTDDGYEWLADLFKQFGPKETKWSGMPERALETAYFDRDKGY